MMKFKRVEGYVLFKDDLLQIEELGGLNSEMIFFNPDKEGSLLNYKIQLTEKVFIREIGELKMNSLTEISENFVLINSQNEIIALSSDLKPEFVDIMLDLMENNIEAN